MSAVKMADGSVRLGNGTVLSASDIAAANGAVAFVPLTVLTGSGRTYTTHRGVPTYGIWFDGVSWNYLDENGDPIPGTSWRVRNLNRAKFTFAK